MAKTCEHLQDLTAADLSLPRTPGAREDCLKEDTRGPNSGRVANAFLGGFRLCEEPSDRKMLTLAKDSSRSQHAGSHQEEIEILINETRRIPWR